MIEIAPSEFWHQTDYHNDALFYCFMLNIDSRIGWRLPNLTETYCIMRERSDFVINTWAWTSDAIIGSQSPGFYQIDLGDGEAIECEYGYDPQGALIIPVRGL